MLIKFSLTQTCLEGVIICEPKIPAFSNLGLLDHIIELIICKDELHGHSIVVYAYFNVNPLLTRCSV
jgi:hypothetical protein